MGDWLERLLPWYDVKEQAKKERRTEAIRLQAQRAVKRSNAVVESYQAASLAIRGERHGF